MRLQQAPACGLREVGALPGPRRCGRHELRELGVQRARPTCQTHQIHHRPARCGAWPTADRRRPENKGDVEQDKSEQKQLKTEEKKFKNLLEFLKDKLDEVKEIKLSSRLKDSASCLVSDENAMSAHMERIMEKMNPGGEGMPPTKRILEINPKHPAVIAVLKLFETDSKNKKILDYTRLFYDQAVLAEGSKINDPSAMAKRINDVLENAAAAELIS